MVLISNNSGEKTDGFHVSPPTTDNRPRHARIQAWRTRERPRWAANLERMSRWQCHQMNFRERS